MGWTGRRTRNLRLGGSGDERCRESAGASLRGKHKGQCADRVHVRALADELLAQSFPRALQASAQGYRMQRQQIGNFFQRAIFEMEEHQRLPVTFRQALDGLVQRRTQGLSIQFGGFVFGVFAYGILLALMAAYLRLLHLERQSQCHHV